MGRYEGVGSVGETRSNRSRLVVSSRVMGKYDGMRSVGGWMGAGRSDEVRSAWRLMV